MEDGMTARIRFLAMALTACSPLAALAESGDAAYCKALAEKYETYLANMTTGRSPQLDSVDGRVAVEQCKAGNAVAAIPVLERKLHNAKIDLPPHG
jgi:hypothetical protein